MSIDSEITETFSEPENTETFSEPEKTETFKEFGLNEELVRAVDELGYETPSPIQLKTIPILLEGRDIVGQAQTGTGKTAAFALPGLQKIDTTTSRTQLLVLTPTRELAIQVAEAFHSYAKHLGRIRVLPVYGGQSISQQIKHLRGGVQVIVGTPGRIMDHMRRETLDISALKMVVLDEADEMLRMGFQEDVEWILSHTPETRQTALFSATMPKQVRRIAEQYLNDPVNIETERKTITVPTISQFYVNLPESRKVDALTRILEVESAPGEAVLVFHRTKMGCDQLVEKLQARGYAAEAMHGDMNQNQREAVVKKLKNGQTEIVVATDVAARGLDVEQITTVVNYDMPGDTEVYVHRIGRTGRAGRQGKAILFVTPRQQRMMRDIESYTKQRIEPFRIPTQADVAARRVEALKQRILDVLEKEELELYLTLAVEIAEETERDVAEIAAAATFLAVGDKPLEVEIRPEPTQVVQQWNKEMTRLYVEVGRRDGVTAANIVAAIANEGKIPGKAIGAIDIYDRFTLVDVPSDLADQVIGLMQNSRIRSQSANVRIAGDEEVSNPPRQNREESRGPGTEFRKFERFAKRFDTPRRGPAEHSGDRPFRKTYGSGGDKPYAKKSFEGGDKPFKKTFEGDEKPFRKNFEGDEKPFKKSFGADERPAPRKSFGSVDKPFKKKSFAAADKPLKGKASAAKAKPSKASAKDEFEKRHPAFAKFAGGTKPPKRKSAGGTSSKGKTKKG